MISLLLFWLPLFGPLVAGFVGGRKAGGVGNAIVAVFLPGIVFGVVLFAIASSLSGVKRVVLENTGDTMTGYEMDYPYGELADDEYDKAQ